MRTAYTSGWRVTNGCCRVDGAGKKGGVRTANRLLQSLSLSVYRFVSWAVCLRVFTGMRLHLCVRICRAPKEYERPTPISQGFSAKWGSVGR